MHTWQYHDTGRMVGFPVIRRLLTRGSSWAGDSSRIDGLPGIDGLPVVDPRTGVLEPGICLFVAPIIVPKLMVVA